jgi:hypothetical protein
VEFGDRPAGGGLAARAEALPASNAAPAAVIPELGLAAVLNGVPVKLMIADDRTPSFRSRWTRRVSTGSS